MLLRNLQAYLFLTGNVLTDSFSFYGKTARRFVWQSSAHEQTYISDAARETGRSRNRRFPQGGIKRWLRRSLKLKLIEFIYRHTIVTSESLALPRMATRKCGGSESNTRRIDRKSSVLTTMLPSHTYYMFVPIDFEKTGVPSFSTGQLLSNLGRRLAESSGESRETGFRGARSWCSVVTVLLHNGLPALDGKD